MQTFVRFSLALLTAGMLTFSAGISADSVGLAISGESAEFEYSTGGDYSDSVDWGFTGYYNSVTHSGSDDKKTSDKIVTMDIETSLEGDSASRLLFSLGGSVYLMVVERLPAKTSKEIQADISGGISLNGKLGYILTTSVPSLFYVAVSASPNIVNTGRVEHFRTARLMYELMLSPAAILQLGYRNYQVDFDDRFEHLEEHRKTIENNVVVGIKLRF